jgi:hypothetical protein
MQCASPAFFAGARFSRGAAAVLPERVLFGIVDLSV